MKRIFLKCIRTGMLGIVFLSSNIFADDVYNNDQYADAPSKKRNIKIEKTENDGIEIMQPSISFSPEYDRYGNVNTANNIYIKGRVKAARYKVFVNVNIVADLYDAEENLIKRKVAMMLPRTFSKYGRKVGEYAIVIENDPRIVLCKLDLSWRGKK